MPIEDDPFEVEPEGGFGDWELRRTFRALREDRQPAAVMVEVLELHLRSMRLCVARSGGGGGGPVRSR